MSETALPAQVQTASAEQTTTQAAAESNQAPSAQDVVQLTLDAASGSVAAIERLESLRNPPAQTADASNATAAVEQQQVEKAKSTAAPVETQAAATTETTPGEKPAEELSERWRFKNPSDRAIAALAKEMDISIPEAVAIIQKGTAKPAEAQALVEEAKPDPNIVALEAESERINAEIEVIAEADPMDPRLRGLAKAQSDNSSALAAKKQAAITRAEILAENAEKDAKSQQAALNAAWAKSEQERLKDYPDLKDPDSAMSTVVAGLIKKIGPQHPDFESLCGPDAPMFLAKKAAKILGKAPATQTSQAAAQTQSTSQQSSEEIVRPVAGSRTSVAPAQEPTADEQIAAAHARVANTLSGKPANSRFDAEDGFVIL